MREKSVVEHVGKGAARATRRQLRHKLLNEQTAYFLGRQLSPKMARFYARTKVDVILSEGSTEVNAHGRGLVRT